MLLSFVFYPEESQVRVRGSRVSCDWQNDQLLTRGWGAGRCGGARGRAVWGRMGKSWTHGLEMTPRGRSVVCGLWRVVWRQNHQGGGKERRGKGPEPDDANLIVTPTLRLLSLSVPIALFSFRPIPHIITPWLSLDGAVTLTFTSHGCISSANTPRISTADTS